MESPLHDRIRHLRRQRGLGQRELAEAVGRDRSWVGHVERGALTPTREQVRRLAAVLGVSPGRLCGGTHCRPSALPPSPLARAVARFDQAGPPPPTPAPSHPPCTPRIVSLLSALPKGVPRLWTALGGMELRDEESWALALTLAGRGALPARLSLARLGFPLPLVAPDGSSASHLRRPCLVWNGPGESLVLFGTTRIGMGGRQFILPLVLAASAEKNVWLVLRPGRSARRGDGVLWVNPRAVPTVGSQQVIERALQACHGDDSPGD